MPVIKISKRTVEAAKVPADADAYYWDSELQGFGLRVTPKGVRSYVLQYRMKGCVARRTTLGKHGQLTADGAREVAKALRLDVAKGQDPVDAKKKRARDARTLLFKDYADRFAEGYLKRKWPASWHNAKRQLELHAVPHFKGRAITEITTGEIKALLEAVSDRVGLARNLYAVLNKMFRWAVKNEDLAKADNPMDSVDAPDTPGARDRGLDDHELLALWRASYMLNDPFGPYVRLLVTTLQRRTEVAGLPWKELSEADSRWKIEAARAKNNRDHLVHLNALAMAELSALGWRRRGLVFTTTGDTPISGFTRLKAQIDRHMLAILQQAENERADAAGEAPHLIELKPWRLHDIRRTGATAMQSLGFPIEVTEKCLNHKSGEQSGLARVYNLWEYQPEKIKAFDQWGGYLSRLIDGADSSNVVPIKAARG